MLPALLAVLKPPGEPAPIGYAALAPVDRFLETQRKWVVGTTLAVTILGLPLLAGLRFDFNPLDLRSQDTESVATLLDLMADPDTSPNTLDILESNAARASALAERLRQLPEVAHVVTLQSFVPKDQDEKLAIIDDASFFLRNTLNPDQVEAEPTPADTLVAIDKTVQRPARCRSRLSTPAPPPFRHAASQACWQHLAKRSPGGPGRSRARSGRAADDDAASGEKPAHAPNM